MDRDRDGFILATEFLEIMALLKNHLMTPFVREHLISSVAVGKEPEPLRKVSFPRFTAAISLLNNMELVKRIYDSLSHQYHRSDITRGEYI